MSLLLTHAFTPPGDSFPATLHAHDEFGLCAISCETLPFRAVTDAVTRAEHIEQRETPVLGIAFANFAY